MAAVKSGRKAKVGIFTASLCQMCYLVPSSLLSAIAKSFPDVSPSVIQMLITLPSLVSIAVALLVGQLSHLLWKKHVIIASTASILLGGMLQALFPHSLAVLMLGCCLLGIGLGGLLTDVSALITDCFTGKECSTVLGIQSAFISGGGALLTFLGGQLGKSDWKNCFWAYGLVAVYLVIEILFLPKGRLSEKPRKAAASGAKLPQQMWVASVTGFLFFLFLTVYNTNISMLVDARGLGDASIAATVYNVAGMLLGFFVGALTAKLHKKIMGMAVALGAVGLLITFLSRNLILTCIGGACAGASFAIFMPSGNFFSSEAAHPDVKAKAISVYSAVSNIGIAVSPILVGSLAGLLHADVAGKFLTAAVACALVAAYLFGFFRDKKPAKAA